MGLWKYIRKDQSVKQNGNGINGVSDLDKIKIVEKIAKLTDTLEEAKELNFNDRDANVSVKFGNNVWVNGKRID